MKFDRHPEHLGRFGSVPADFPEQVIKDKLILSTQKATSFSHFDQLLWKQETLAGFLSVDRTTIWRWVEAGKIKRVELLPGLFRFRTSDALTLGNIAPRIEMRALIEIATAAWLLSVDRTTIWRLRKFGALDAVVLGPRAVRFRYFDLLRLANHGPHFQRKAWRKRQSCPSAATSPSRMDCQLSLFI